MTDQRLTPALQVGPRRAAINVGGGVNSTGIGRTSGIHVICRKVSSHKAGLVGTFAGPWTLAIGMRRWRFAAFAASAVQAAERNNRFKAAAAARFATGAPVP